MANTISVVALLLSLNSLYSFKKGPLQGVSFFCGWLFSELCQYVSLLVGLFFIYIIVSHEKLIDFSTVLFFIVFLISLFHVIISVQTGHRLSKMFQQDSATVVPFIKAFTLRPRVSKSTKFKDIPYAQDSPKQKLDIYVPKKPSTKMPVVVFIHGGGWVLGSKSNQGKTWAYAFIRCGLIFVSINYRLSPKATWPEHIIDCKLALAWVKENIDKYSGDPEKIIVSGGSAGGHLASLAALTPNDKNFQPGFEQKDTNVFGCLSLYGVYDLTNSNSNQSKHLVKLLSSVVFKKSLYKDPEPFKQASPLFRITESACPFIIIHGTNDSLVNVKDTRIFFNTLKQSSKNPYIYLELPFTQHAFDIFWSLRSVLVVDHVSRFINNSVRTNSWQINYTK